MDINDVPALLRDDVQAEEVFFENYQQQPQTWRRFCDVRDASETNLYGKVGTVVQGIGDFKEREDGAEVQADQFGQGPSWYCKIKQHAVRIDLPFRMVDGASRGQLAIDVARMTQHAAKSAARKQNALIAGMYNNGMKSAGSLEYFDGRHTNGVDPHPKFVYDGKPWFASDHPLSGEDVTATLDNYEASLSLTYAGLETVLNKFETADMALDERGKEIELEPRFLIVPPGLEGTAHRIINSELIPGSSNNDINHLRGRLEVVKWKKLSDPAGWFVSTGEGVIVYESAMTATLHRDDKTKTWSLIWEFLFGAQVQNVRGDHCANLPA